ncbi:MAG: tRNA pseudouridine(55) synthase TruB [Clostridiaceae bacterium]|jgi:tRNA pseudouridine55 synthase|nr:tRNA pseudouridine(55) synthase TruB [Clostridiaceae bacterium]
MNGIYNVNKPSGMTSNDVTVRIRKILRNACTVPEQASKPLRVGHMGTLDPLADGVLVVGVGTAARLFQIMSGESKTYRAGFAFGVETDTLDGEGRVTAYGREPSEGEILCAAERLKECRSQIPPRYSSLKINGEKAYDMARAGKDFELASRPVEIFHVDFLGKSDRLNRAEGDTRADEYLFDIACSGGTYIRSIARDLAYSMDTVGYMSSLTRLRCGGFMLENSVTLEQIAADPLAPLMPLSNALSKYPRFIIPPSDERWVLNGIKKQYDALPNGLFTVYAASGLVGMAENQDGFLSFILRF